MPPKKSQRKDNKTLKKCNFNNRGYCKNKNECSKDHSEVVCDDQKCDELKCIKRHPYQCKYGMYCKFNKKNECHYSHVTLASDDGKIEALNKAFNNKVNSLEKSLVSLQNELAEKDSFINTLIKKFQVKEEDFISFKEDLKNKNSKINGFELKLDEIEKKHKSDKQVKDRKIKELEMVLKNKTKQEHIVEDFKCTECDFISKTKSGLKIHKVRIHTKTNNLPYPVECELCEAKVANEKDMKEHMKFHSYKKSTFKCEDCDYCSENFLTMEVHVGKLHNEKIECGMCNYEAKDIEGLNLHISTCEIYVCDDCCFRTVHIHDIKKHLKNEHTRPYDSIIHGKVNLKDPEIIDHTKYYKLQLCSSP